MAAGVHALHSPFSTARISHAVRRPSQECSSQPQCPCIASVTSHIPSKAPAQQAGSTSKAPLLRSLQHSRGWSSTKLTHAVTRGERKAHRGAGTRSPCCAALKALVFDCDGVILESEDLHREAYNAAFKEFDVRCPNAPDGAVVWTPDFYDMLQNTVGGGKPKMRWYFSKNGWPTSTILPEAPKNEEEQAKLVDTLQDWKSAKFRDFIGSGSVKPRPGILEVMDAARATGLKVAVCSASTKESCVFTLSNLIGKDRFESLDCFLAGDDVNKKKPDPEIYVEAVKRLGIPAEKCLVIEDSAIGLAAALGGGMSCVITTTPSTASQKFEGAAAVYGDMDGVTIDELMALVDKKAAVAS
ncbi:Haloacid dehalogenase-like hydrolase (HAD)-superfamily hydrolase subfamily IA [Klebsormidium nitens]|uniref:Haloacid dehalogenase-like hydrolase (HAD)-superfamily hydrolase subfamily IA n=1 Tax=Klebsormidium nitens TaxID=105231 RepID=A0A1Y1I9Q6_KLENI|nr:Haloacid dehalogenase-like hydrolase (HAD)-superfamily hydrolase subfamily IA [Klebsormidium nitens]|eukprot:GAQ84818.1 Haloacid dehalogenase-like hydrolase (HAD)-superfamily hydrolase subfamily IA [Klebsormidium nitens]